MNQYIKKYTLYFEELYSDTGLWNENQIIESYKKEWYARYDEIIDTLVAALSKDVITYTWSETIIHWRSKVIFVRFRDEEALRIIDSIEIR